MAASQQNYNDDYQEGELPDDHSPPHPLIPAPDHEASPSSSDIIFETVTKPLHKPQPKKKKIHKQTRTEHRQIKIQSRENREKPRAASSQRDKDKNRQKDTKQERERERQQGRSQERERQQGRSQERERQQGRSQEMEVPPPQPVFSGYPHPLQPNFFVPPHYYTRPPYPHPGMPMMQTYPYPVQPYYPPFMPNYGVAPPFLRNQGPYPSIYPSEPKPKVISNDFHRQSKSPSFEKQQQVRAGMPEEKGDFDIQKTSEVRLDRTSENGRRRTFKEDIRGILKRQLKCFSSQEQLNILQMLKCLFRNQNSPPSLRNSSFQSSLSWIETLGSTEDRKGALSKLLETLGLQWVAGGLQERKLYMWAMQDPNFQKMRGKSSSLLEDPYCKFLN